ncbi:uncharacterized protein LOC122193466, partial [Lagopus leucura]|uniref:uncharacterized protein LOC122193466 n=1 Tax=Lagopus leucura TaxID=30410 RepID=UPI001C6790F3
MNETLLQHFPGPQDKIYSLLDSMRRFIARRVRSNAQSLEPSNPRDFIDCFLLQMDKEKNDPNSEFTMENLELTALNLFFAGTETISSTLRYGFVLLMKNPAVLGERRRADAEPLQSCCIANPLQNHCKAIAWPLQSHRVAELLQTHCKPVANPLHCKPVANLLNCKRHSNPLPTRSNRVSTDSNPVPTPFQPPSNPLPTPFHPRANPGATPVRPQ